MKRIFDILLMNDLKISVAESFTGGNLASAFIAMPGASSVFCASIVAYTDEMKNQLLVVPREILTKYGAVSEPCVKSMALGAINRTKSDISVATTGFAGPATNRDTLPVGTFFIAVSDGETSVVKKYCVDGDRKKITDNGVAEAIELLYNFLKDKYKISP